MKRECVESISIVVSVACLIENGRKIGMKPRTENWWLRKWMIINTQVSHNVIRNSVTPAPFPIPTYIV